MTGRSNWDSSEGISVITGFEIERVFLVGGILIDEEGEIMRVGEIGRIFTVAWGQTESTGGLCFDLEKIYLISLL